MSSFCRRAVKVLDWCSWKPWHFEPIVAMASAGTLDVVGPNREGISSTVRATGDAIAMVIGDRALAMRLGDAGYRTIVGHFSSKPLSRDSRRYSWMRREPRQSLFSPTVAGHRRSLPRASVCSAPRTTRAISDCSCQSLRRLDVAPGAIAPTLDPWYRVGRSRLHDQRLAWQRNRPCTFAETFVRHNYPSCTSATTPMARPPCIARRKRSVASVIASTSSILGIFLGKARSPHQLTMHRVCLLKGCGGTNGCPLLFTTAPTISHG